MKDFFVTVIEHEYYLKRAEKLLNEEQRLEIVNILTVNPKSGDLIQSTGGCRKVRYAGVKGKGKSGGARIITFFVNHNNEIHLLEVFGKNEKSNLAKAERNTLAQLTKILKGK